MTSQTPDILFAWASRTIRGRYQQSLLGGLWAVIQPAASVAIFSIIFTQFVPVNTGSIPYPVFSFVAVVPWSFLATSLADMAASLVQNMNLVTKIYFPREALPLAAMLARLLDLSISVLVLVVLMFIFRVPAFPLGWLLLPLILLLQIALVAGVGLIASALNVFYRDVQPFLTLFTQLWFYASPIIYPVSLVPEQYRTLYFLNPMAGIIVSYRTILLEQKLPGPELIPAAIISIVVFLFGYWLFKRVEPLFADVV
jgi:lipopolysaccharide transport system permease protein